MMRTIKWTLRSAARSICVVLLWIVAGTAQPANAADLELDWIAPPECSTVDEVRSRLLNLLQGAEPSNVSAVIEVTRSNNTYRAEVLLRNQTGFGKRQLEHRLCDVLADSVAVLIALSIPTQAKPDLKRGLALTLSPEGRLLAGSLPSLATGVGGTIAFEGFSVLRLELQAGYYLPQSTTFGQSAAGGEFKLLTFGICVGRLWNIGRVQWAASVGAQVHRVSAVGFGGMTQLLGSTSWWGPSLRLLGRVQLLSMLGISLAIEGMLPVFRPEFIFVNGGQLHRVGPIALQVSVGPEVKF